MITQIIGGNNRRREIFKRARMRKRKSRDLDHVTCIKSDEQKVLEKDNDIKEMWREILTKFEDPIGGSRMRGYFC